MTAAQTTELPTPTTDTPAVCVRSLSHTYKPLNQRRSHKHAPPSQDAALDNIDLDVQPGEVFALLGPNGSGKSTLLRILATMLTPRGNQGTATIFGSDITADAQAVRQHLGVVFQHPALDLKLSAYENLSVHAKLYGLAGSALGDTIKQALDQLGLADRMHDHVESFSGGMRRRVEIAKALLTQPRLLLMDEASAGLDIAIQRDIWADLRKLVADTGLTVLLTTHLMEEADQADRVAVMAKGNVVAVESPDALVAKVGGQVLEITPRSGTSADRLCELVSDAIGDQLENHRPIASQGRAHLEHPEAPSMIATLSDQLGEQAIGFRLGRPTLADAYLKLTGQSLDT
ncbi:MAG: ABC transporter ATP-binding protein [Phycisphaeraceae bacterium]|nr:ABC transporter ATP-binding protein [Phycisphaeraceae bacterium]